MRSFSVGTGFAAALVLVAIGLSGCAGERSTAETVEVSTPPGLVPRLDVPGDASWPPAPIADPDPISIVIPVDWPEADRERAREWVTIQQDTRQCQLQRGIDSYRYLPVWEETYDDSGVLVASGPPPADWDAHFKRPFQWFRSSAVVCFNRALVRIGHPSSGPLEFPKRAPRFEESDFSDASTLDIPSEWTQSEQAAARDSWKVELEVRSCMAAAGFAEYGEPPYWLMTDDHRAEDPWISTFPLAAQPAVVQALSGDYDNNPYDWSRGGCTGQARHDVEGL